MKYKELGGGWYCQNDENGDKFDFTKKNKPGFYAAMMKWIDEGNAIESEYTTEELAQKEIDDLSSAKNSFNLSVKTRLLESDKWELPSVLILIGKTIEEVIGYKQLLRDMSKTHTTLEQYLNPGWPEKLTTKEML